MRASLSLAAILATACGGAAPSPTVAPANRATAAPDPAAPVDLGLTGSYSAGSATLDVVDSPGRTILFYQDLFAGDHTCVCEAEAARDGATYTLAGKELAGTFTVAHGAITFAIDGEPECCGAQWPGMPSFALASRVAATRCAVLPVPPRGPTADPPSDVAPVTERLPAVDGGEVFAIETEGATFVRFASGGRPGVAMIESSRLRCPERRASP